MKKFIFTIFIFFLAGSFLSNPALALTFDSKTTNKEDKKWTIRFNSEISSTINLNSNVYIQDSDGNRHSAEAVLSSDGKAIILTPDDPYYIGKSYRVVVNKGISSKSGKLLKEQAILPFSLKGDYIHSASAVLNPFATNFTVQGTSSVYQMTASLNGSAETTLHRNAGNQFSYGMIGLISGDIITIRAYSTTGKLLEHYNYEVTD